VVELEGAGVSPQGGIAVITRLSHVTILVHDQDEALRFYTEKLGFEKRSDVAFGPGMRWLTVAPAGQSDLEIVLQKPDPAMHGEESAQQMQEMVGRGTTWVFECDDCRATYATLRERGVEFQSELREEPYGIEAVFVDLYGNSFSLLQPSPPRESGADANAETAERTGMKAALIAALRDDRAALDVVLKEISEARMTEPDATGHWSVKDVLAHIAVGEEWAAEQIERATRGGPPPSAERLQTLGEEGWFDNEFRNTHYYEQNKDRPLADVRAWSRETHERLLAAIEAAPEAALAEPDWWTGGRPLGQSVTTVHGMEHAQELRAWLAQES
jgi:predicted enzyme related to lactoylglutathione lyase